MPAYAGRSVCECSVCECSVCECSVCECSGCECSGGGDDGCVKGGSRCVSLAGVRCAGIVAERRMNWLFPIGGTGLFLLPTKLDGCCVLARLALLVGAIATARNVAAPDEKYP